MMKNSKNMIFLILRKNRHCLCAIFIAFVIIFSYAFDSFAENISYFDYSTNLGGTGSFTSAGTVASTYALTNEGGHYPFLATNEMRSYYTGNGTLFMGGSNATTFGGDSTVDDYDSLYDSSNDSREFFVPITFSAQGHNTECAIGAGYTVCTFAPQTASSQKFICNYRFWSEGKVAIYLNTTDNTLAVVSNTPLSYAFTRSRAYNGGEMHSVGFGTIEDGTGGLFIKNFDSQENVIFANMPIYLPSSDSASGYSFDNAFSFENENINFNNLLQNGFVIDPFPEGGVEVPVQAKVNMKFRNSAYYTGTGLNQFFHFNQFNFNEYMIENPSKFRIRFQYRVHFKNNLGTDNDYFYNPGDVKLEYFLGRVYRFNQPTTLAVPLHSNLFLDNNGNRLTNVIISTLNTATGQSTEYINPNGLFENVIAWTDALAQYEFGTGNLELGIPIVSNVYDGVIQEFTIYSNVSIYYADDETITTFPYEDKHSFVTGDTEALSTDNTQSPYSSDLPDIPSADYPQQNGSGGVTASNGSAVATIQKGAVTIVNNGGGGSSLTQAYHIDDVNIAGLADTMNFIVNTIGSDRATNGFWAVMKNSYDYFPEDFWDIMLLGITTVVGISVVKVCLTTFRNK